LKFLTCSALLISITLAACGGGGGGGPSTAATTTTTTTTPSGNGPRLASVSQVIEYYGDSTIWGWATGSNGAQVAKPAPLAFDEAFPASPAQDVRNEGVSGTTACQLLNGDGKHSPWDIQMTNSPATVVIVSYGINDAKPGSGVSVAAYKSCLLSLAQIAKSKGKRFILETSNPVSGFSGLENYVAAMREAAAQESVSLIDQFQYLTDYLNGRNPAEITPDGLHPTDEVYVMKGRYAESVFVTLPL
jgi:lysophospholipase L1-like esterase